MTKQRSKKERKTYIGLTYSKTWEVHMYKNKNKREK